MVTPGFHWLIFLILIFSAPLVQAAKTSNLSPSELVGRHLMISVSGKVLTHKDREVIRQVRPGAVVLFKFNVESVTQLLKLISDIQKESRESLGRSVVIAVDQEGGDVIRIKTNDSLPSARALGEINDLHLTREAGERTGQLLSAFGIQLNLAPVLDVLPRSSSALLMTRSYSQNPDVVLRHATAFSDGLLKYGVIPTFKHFPGHGSSRYDSHLVLPVAEGSIFDLISQQLRPFRSVAHRYSQQSAIMMAHVRFPQLEARAIPATFSNTVIEQILRKDFQYKGVVITDDLEMKALSPYGSLSERARLALTAGSNLVMVLWSAKKQMEVAKYLVQYVHNHEEFGERLKLGLEPLELFKQPDRSPSSEAEIVLHSRKLVKGLSQSLNLKDQIQFQATLALAEKHKARIEHFPWHSVTRVYSKDERDFRLVQSLLLGQSSARWIPLHQDTLPDQILSASDESNSIWISTGETTAKLFGSLPKKFREQTFVFDFKGYINSEHAKNLIKFYFRPTHLKSALSPYINSAKNEHQSTSPGVSKSSLTDQGSQ